MSELQQRGDPASEARAEKSEPSASGAAEVVLAALSDRPLSVDAVLRAVRHPAAGAVVTFVGYVREQDHGTEVTALDYSAHDSATAVLQALAQRLSTRHGLVRLAAVHRVGHLEIGDVAVVVAVSSVHRAAAFEVCRELIDTLKSTVPIWKHQLFADGSDEWVGMP